tara:strand:+ start:8653 stop:9162 length:510 start_codon:yes stop_codon:yes gene_type:complete
MALWGNNDNVGSAGTVALNYSTGVVTGTGTTFGETGAAQEGDVIRFGERGGTYMGDAVIVSVASTISCTIGSTMGLSGVAIAGTTFTVSQLPKSSVLDQHYSETNSDFDSLVYGVNGAEGVTSQYLVTHEGWVGVTTYNDNEGNLRVKKETLVAMSGITTAGIAYPTDE